jgi:hypothetical protein
VRVAGSNEPTSRRSAHPSRVGVSRLYGTWFFAIRHVLPGSFRDRIRADPTKQASALDRAVTFVEDLFKSYAHRIG